MTISMMTGSEIMAKGSACTVYRSMTIQIMDPK